VVGSGFDEAGREIAMFAEGGFVHPAPWRDDSVAQVGALLRRLHEATASFRPSPGAVWRRWHGRGLGEGAGADNVVRAGRRVV
jgi:Ser/Thr protein kinase RdoA (MazF antagonist)